MMKKPFIIFLAVLLAIVSCNRYDEVWAELRDHEERLQKLEALCGRLNSNVEAIQTILTAMEQNDYVTDIVKVMEDGVEVGYSITFAKGGTVTIYHGTDGADGAAPQVGIRKAQDGEYYWTADGEWVTDENGERIPAVVADDPDGEYVTPQFRIADGKWYVSVDNGNSWLEIDNPGHIDEEDSESESEGDSVFSKVDTSNEEYVIFTLSDGTQFKIPRYQKSKSYWYGKKMVMTGSSIPAGSGLSSKTSAFPYLVAEQLGMSLINYSIGGTVVAKRPGDYDECYYDKTRWEEDKKNGLLDKSKKYLVNTGTSSSLKYQIYSYNGTSWVGGGTSSDNAGRFPLSDRVGEMDDDADVIMLMSGSNDFYYNWNPFGDFNDGLYRNYVETEEDDSIILDMENNLIDNEEVEFISIGGPNVEGPDYIRDNPEYFTYRYIPIKGGHAVKVPYGRNGWWVDSQHKGISLINFTKEGSDYTLIAPANATSLVVCFKYAEVAPEDVVIYQSVYSMIPIFDDSKNIVEDGELVENCAPTPQSSVIDYSYSQYFTCRLVPIKGGHAIKVPYGRNAWWIDENMNDISLVNFTNGSSDFTHIAPENAAYMTVCFKYEEVQPEDIVIYMSESPIRTFPSSSEGKSSNEPNETFCDGLHKMFRTLLKKYKDKDIIMLIPIKRVQETHWSCIYPEDTNKYGKSLNDYRKAIIEACEYYSIMYIDLYTLSGLNPHIDPSMFADTDGRAVHPNEEGHKKLASVIVAQMESMR
jgi:hypothetical protein